MIHNLIVHEIERCGGTKTLAERLLIYGRKPFITWLVHRFCEREYERNVSETLEDFATITGLSLNIVRHSYYRASVHTLIDAKREDGYKELCRVLEERFPYPALWGELLRYAYSAVRRFAVELLIERDTPSVEICDILNVSQSMVYQIRRAAIARYIQKKGDNPDDSKHY